MLPFTSLINILTLSVISILSMSLNIYPIKSSATIILDKGTELTRDIERKTTKEIIRRDKNSLSSEQLDENIVCSHQYRADNTGTLLCGYRSSETIFILQGDLLLNSENELQIEVSKPYLAQGRVRNNYSLLMLSLIQAMENYIEPILIEDAPNLVTTVSILIITPSNFLKEELINQGYTLEGRPPILLTGGYRHRLRRVITP